VTEELASPVFVVAGNPNRHVAFRGQESRPVQDEICWKWQLRSTSSSKPCRRGGRHLRVDLAYRSLTHILQILLLINALLNYSCLHSNSYNSTAVNNWRHFHITDALASLQWPRVPEWIQFKIAVMAYKVLHGQEISGTAGKTYSTSLHRMFSVPAAKAREWGCLSAYIWS